MRYKTYCGMMIGLIVVISNFASASCEAQGIFAMRAPWQNAGRNLTCEYVLMPTATHLRTGRSGIVVNRVMDETGRVISTATGDFRLLQSNTIENVSQMTVWWDRGGVEQGTLDFRRLLVIYKVHYHSSDPTQVGDVLQFRKVQLQGAFGEQIRREYKRIREFETDEFFKRLRWVTQ